MLLWTVLFVLVLVVFGFGFTLHVLWYVAVALLILWGIGFLMRGRFSGRSAGRSHRQTGRSETDSPRAGRVALQAITEL